MPKDISPRKKTWRGGFVRICSSSADRVHVRAGKAEGKCLDSKCKKRVAIIFALLILGLAFHLLDMSNLFGNHRRGILRPNMSKQFDDPVKNEVWQTLRALNDAWSKGHVEDLKNYFHKNMVAITATDRNRLEGRDACFASWEGFVKAGKIHFWKEIDPNIQIYGNTAIVTYYFDLSFDMDGKANGMGGRDMFVFVKEDGKWWAVADQFSPYP